MGADRASGRSAKFLKGGVIMTVERKNAILDVLEGLNKYIGLIVVAFGVMGYLAAFLNWPMIWSSLGIAPNMLVSE